MPEPGQKQVVRLFRLRPDLEFSEHVAHGKREHVVKDPVAMRYFRFSDLEYFIIGRLDGQTPLPEIRQQFIDHFKTDLPPEELQTFLKTLDATNLLLFNTAIQDSILFQRSRLRRKKKRKAMFTNFLFIKFPLIDPNRFLGKVEPYLWFFWTKAFALILFFLCVSAAGLVFGDWDRFAQASQSFLTLGNLPYLWLAIILSTCLHELGHGFTCKHYGGEVHELGFLLLVLNPCLYCNLSDAWLISDRTHRFLTTASGILTQFLIAALSAWVWYFTSPGFVNTLCVNLFITNAISSVFFNLNPLLKFDGYYMVMDYLEIPNLRMKAQKYVWQGIMKYFLGGDVTLEHVPPKHKWFFPMYSIASFCYRLFIVVAITFSMYWFFRNAGLVLLANGMLAFGLVTMILLPPIQMVKAVMRDMKKVHFQPSRMAITGAVVLLLILGVFLFPLDQYVTVNFELVPHDKALMYVESPGFLKRLGVKTGQSVRKGQLLAVLENDDLRMKADLAVKYLEQKELRVKILQQSRRADLVKQSRELVRIARERVELAREQIKRLTLRSPIDGVVLSDVPDDRIGRFYQPGEIFMVLGDPEQMEARVLITEEDFGKVVRGEKLHGQPTELEFYAWPGHTVQSTVASVSPRNIQALTEQLALSQMVGGEMATKVERGGGPIPTLKPRKPTYELIVPLPAATDEALALQPGLTGKASIHCGSWTLFSWSWDSLLRLLNLEFFL